MTDKIKIITLLGKGGSGKTTAQEMLCQKEDYHLAISCTTRPMRENEVDGVHYHFLTHQEFFDEMIQESFIEALEFNGWFYGTRVQDLDPARVNVGVFTPEGVRTLLDTASAYNLEVMTVLIKVDDKVRLARTLNRESNPDVGEACRRFLADSEDFSKIDFPIDLTISNDGDETALADSVKIIERDSKDFFVQGV